MKKKGKMRVFPGQRSPQQVVAPPPGAPGAVKQRVTELDWYKWRLALQKEQTIRAKQNEIQRYKDLLAREEENVKLRIALLQTENQSELAHLNLGQGDQLSKEGGEFYVVRAPRPGPIPPVNGAVPPAPPADLPAVPPAMPPAAPPAAPPPPVADALAGSTPLPPVPSAGMDDDDGEDDDDEDGEEGEEAVPEPPK